MWRSSTSWSPTTCGRARPISAASAPARARKSVRPSPGGRGVLEDDGGPLGAHPIPVVETEADVGGGEHARARVGYEAQSSRPDEILQLVPAHVYRHAVLARAERHEHRQRRPPDVAALVKEAVDAERGVDQEEAREEEPVHEEIALGHGACFFCGSSAGLT